MRLHLRGGYAIPSALVLLVLCGVAAIAIDLGYGRLVQAQLQAVSDASAHAGALQLNQAESGLRNARAAAVAVAAANVADGATVPMPDANVETGIWDHDASLFTPSTDVLDVNAVSVLARIDHIDTWFAGPAFRRESIAASGRATAVLMPPPAACAVLAATELDATGSMATDSYDSTAGPYDPAFAGAQGSVCGNAVVDLGGDVSVGGDAVVGRGGEILTHGNALEMTGTQRYFGSKFELPELDSTDAETHNDNHTVGLTSKGRDPWQRGGIRLTSTETLELAGGVYYFETLKIAGSAALVLTGPTEIWVGGDVDVGGTGIINQGGDPHDLTLFCLGDDVSLGGTSDFYGSLIAPGAEVNLGGTHDFFGIVIGWSVDISGDLRLHADTSLMGPLVQIQPWIALVQ